MLTLASPPAASRSAHQLPADRREYEARLAEQWAALPRFTIRRFFAHATRQFGEIEVESEANFAFFKAIRHYKPSYLTKEGKSVQFNTYAVNVIARNLRRYVSDRTRGRERMPTLSIFVGRDRGKANCPPGVAPTDAIAINYKDIESARDAREEIAERLAKLRPVHREIFLDWLGGFLDAKGNERPRLSATKLAVKYQSNIKRIMRVICHVREQLGVKVLDGSHFARSSRAPVSPSAPSAA